MLMKVDRFLPLFALILLAAIGLTAMLVPADVNLGDKLGMILLHGAWVWAAMLLFLLASVIMLGWLVTHSINLYRAGLAVALVALLFWLLYLPQSMWVMKANWGGFYFSEPRWQIPFTFGVAGVVVAIGLSLMRNRYLSGAAIIAFTIALLFNISRISSVLHPGSPVGASGSGGIKTSFAVLLALIFSLGLLAARFLRSRLPESA